LSLLPPVFFGSLLTISMYACDAFSKSFAANSASACLKRASSASCLRLALSSSFALPLPQSALFSFSVHSTIF
jgi:hypothetical protein